MKLIQKDKSILTIDDKDSNLGDTSLQKINEYMNYQTGNGNEAEHFKE